MKIGSRIKVHGLVSAAKYNDRQGTIIHGRQENLVENSESRFLIVMDDGKELRIKGKNLEQLTAEYVVNNLTEQQKLYMMKSNNIKYENSTTQDYNKMLLENIPEEVIVNFGKWDPAFQAKVKQSVENLKNMSPDHIRSSIKYQIDMLRRDPSTLDLIKAQNPAMAPLSYEQVISQLETMAKVDPNTLKDMAEMQSKGMSPTQAKNMMSKMDPEQMKKMLKTQRDMLKANPDLIHELRKANPQMKNLTVEQVEQQLDMMSSLDNASLEKMAKIQSGGNKEEAEKLFEDPEFLEKMMENNPMMKGMSRETIKKNVEKIKQMTPEQREKMMNVAKNVQKVVQPVHNAYSNLGLLTRGNQNIILMLILAVIVGIVLQYGFGVQIL